MPNKFTDLLYNFPLTDSGYIIDMISDEKTTFIWDQFKIIIIEPFN